MKHQLRAAVCSRMHPYVRGRTRPRPARYSSEAITTRASTCCRRSRSCAAGSRRGTTAVSTTPSRRSTPCRARRPRPRSVPSSSVRAACPHAAPVLRHSLTSRVSRAPCPHAAPVPSLSHLTLLPCTRVEGVERPRRRGAGQARMELHGVSALSECRAVLWNGRGRWGQPRWLHAPPIHNVSLYYHRFFLHTCKTLTKNRAPPLGSSSPRLRLDTLLSRLSSPQSERNVPQNLRRCAVAGASKYM